MKKITNFAINYDNETKKQFDHCCSQDFVKEASLMPDAHSGYVAPIGSVLKTKDFVVPAWVGYDIGCGMIACKFNRKNIINDIKLNSQEIFDEVNKIIPMGKGAISEQKFVSLEIKNNYKKLLEKFSKKEHNKEIYKFLRTQALAHLGSLGSGNHFIELLLEKNGSEDELWLVIHSGSRGVGHKVATHYMKQASNNENKYEITSKLDVNSQIGKEYLNILEFGLEFALLNRLEMAYRVKKILKKIINKNLDFELWVNKNHNHCIKENNYYIHRKGATPAKLNERGVIPANMRDGCFLVRGLGNKDYLESSSHGAGRKLSRNEARNTIKINDFENSMIGITGNINESTIDEAPMAYKNIFEVMKAQESSVKIVSHLLPIINWKG